MSDTTPEGGLVQEQGAPTPKFQNVDDSVSSVEAGKALTAADIEALIDKRVQSTKDRRYANLEREVGGLKADLQALFPESVLTEHADKIDRYLLQRKVDELTARVEGNPQQEQPAPKAQTSHGNAEWDKARGVVQQIFAQAGFAGDPAAALNSAEFLEFMSENNNTFEDGVDMVSKASAFAAKRQSQTPSPALRVQPPAAPQPSAGDSQSELQAEYQKRLAAIRPGSIDAVTNLKREYRGKGLNVW